MSLKIIWSGSLPLVLSSIIRASITENPIEAKTFSPKTGSSSRKSIHSWRGGEALLSKSLTSFPVRKSPLHVYQTELITDQKKDRSEEGYLRCRSLFSLERDLIPTSDYLFELYTRGRSTAELPIGA
ncbi:hypothetical protein Tco_0413878 [Tanacetum coccineum]